MRLPPLRWHPLRILLCRTTVAPASTPTQAGTAVMRQRKRARARIEWVQAGHAQLIVDAKAAQRALAKLSEKSSHEQVVADIAQRKAMAIGALLGDVRRLSEGTLIDKMRVCVWGRRHRLLAKQLERLQKTLAADHYWLILAEEGSPRKPSSALCPPATLGSHAMERRQH